MVENFKQRVLLSSPYTVPAIEAQQQMLTHQKELIETARTFTGGYAKHPHGDDEEESELG